MSTNINKNRIGAFICVAITLFIISIIFLSKNTFFSEETEFVMFFKGSVSGLSVGAPVVFRGVPLGHVTNISLFASSKKSNVTIPVTIKINKANILHKGSATATTDDDEPTEGILSKMVERGLRARLEMSSFLTGQSRIELDFFPNTVATYMGEEGKLEIPTIDSAKDQVMRTLSGIPVEEIAKNLNESLIGISNLVNNEKLITTLNHFNTTLDNSNILFTKLNSLSEKIETLVINSNHSVEIINRDLPRLMSSFNKAMINSSTTFNQLEKTFVNIENVISQDSVTVRNFNNAIKEFERASRGVNELTNMLERNPEVLLLGKGERK